jgi:biotin carboxyl carrier protein
MDYWRRRRSKASYWDMSDRTTRSPSMRPLTTSTNCTERRPIWTGVRSIWPGVTTLNRLIVLCSCPVAGLSTNSTLGSRSSSMVASMFRSGRAPAGSAPSRVMSTPTVPPCDAGSMRCLSVNSATSPPSARLRFRSKRRDRRPCRCACRKQAIVDQTRNRAELARQQLASTIENEAFQLAPAEAAVSQRRAEYERFVNQLDDLNVKSTMSGLLQVVSVEMGQQVGAGANLVRVSDPSRLKAEVRVAETQTRDLAIGQVASVSR